MNALRSMLLFGCIAAALNACAPVKPLTSYDYSVPKTNNVSLVVCYDQLGLFEGGLKPSTYFPKDVQQENAQFVGGVMNALERAGYHVTLNNECKDPWTTDNQSVKVTLKLLVMPVHGNGVLAAAFVIPQGTKRHSIPSVIQIPYGDGTTHLKDVFPKVPPALIRAIKKGQGNSTQSDVL